ncbi:MAG: hypothetical protein PWQ55_818 [Chloroflexota bacterium]|nr:hypothetical protein [Chloroflexota bacterium]
MGTGIYFNLPAHGHINPTLPLVAELTGRGERILYYGTESFRSKIESSGAEFRPYSFSGKHLDDETIAVRNFVSISGLLLRISARVCADFFAETDLPPFDYVLHDSMCPWGKYIANHLGLPAINTTTTFFLNHKTLNQSSSIYETIWNMLRESGWRDLPANLRLKRKLDREYGPRSGVLDIFRNVEDLNLVFTSRYFQPAGESLPKTYQFIGPSIAKRPDAPAFDFGRLLDQPLVYISLGTLAVDKAEFFRQCVQALAGAPYSVLMSVGDTVDPQSLEPLPENVMVRQSVPQLAVLERAGLFISHGGMNSVNEALYFGVPLILVPQQAEQAMVAQRVQALGAGIVFPEENIAADLLGQVNRMFYNASFRQHAAEVRASFLAAGGYARGAQLVLDHVGHPDRIPSGKFSD